MKKNSLFAGILIVIVAFLMFLRPVYGWKLRKLLTPNFYGESSDAAKLLAENQELKAEVAKLQKVKSDIREIPPAYLGAIVYSRYPMNFKNEMLIAAGESDGVSLNRAVVFEGVLIGKVEEVFDEASLVQTVFDSRFQSAVRIGQSGTDALLRGGSLPKATLIPLKSNISKGDVVYSASRDFPYGLPIGEVASVSVSSDQLFQEASLNFIYDINVIGSILVSKR